MNKYQKQNIQLYQRHKEDIQKGWWGWHGLFDRFQCVKCGETLTGSEFVTGYIKKGGEEACKKIHCYNCYKSS
ncbi:hypothetical protein MYX07_00225 [Patescibacteria group bacterium AH-259-L07]|nr:hypothetical protein [Patescibacteria group bacterium AH-259-L07]